MRGRVFAAAAALGLTVLSLAGGDILLEVKSNLDLAKKSLATGEVERALQHTLVVSPDQQIRVRVDCGNLKGPQQTAPRNALNGAIRMWQEALGTELFTVCETGPADVVVSFQPEVQDRGISVAAHVKWARGVANEKTNPKMVLTATIFARTFRPTGEPLTFEQMRASLAHELGHVLGLSDSDNARDAMGPMNFGRPVCRISPDEVRLLIEARAEAQRIRQTILSRRMRK